MIVKYQEYIVQSGDTLKFIAEKYLDSEARYKEILDQNGDPLTSDVIQPGDVLLIPVEDEVGSFSSSINHLVQGDDTLPSIAKKYYGNPRTVQPIMTANGIDTNTRLQTGQILKIPLG